MPIVQDVLNAIEITAPAHLAFEFDKVGLQVGSRDTKVSKAVVSLDRSLGAVREAKRIGAQLLVAHHPLVFSPMDRIVADDEVGQTIIELIESRISFIAAHTNWDCAIGGVNDVLADLLGLQDVVPFGSAASNQLMKIVTYVPEKNADEILDALSAAGAGNMGNYSRCAFLSTGNGTFVGNEYAQPSVGEAGTKELVSEIRIEMICDAAQRRTVEETLLTFHPYEEPAFDIYPLASTKELCAGRIGHLSSPAKLDEFCTMVEQVLKTRVTAWGSNSQIIERVAVVGGAADGEWSAAVKEGADVLITGEVKQHNALSAVQADMAMIAAGHYATEQPGVVELALRLKSALPEIEWHLYEPEPGRDGRPL